ncbi:MAG: adenylyl-sulfate kinase [Verrucomicrobiales bacterium]|nr:adenylyl-sulfate kinase [Verrucomicrobiales bacterium]
MSLRTPLGEPVVTPLPAPQLAREQAHAAQGLPAVQLTPHALANLVCLATGVFAPLERFMTAADYARVLAEMRCADGTLFPLPLTLDLDERALPKRGDRLALRDEGNEPVAILTLEEIFTRDPVEETKAILGTCDPRHPFVAERSHAGTVCVSGAIDLLTLPRSPDGSEPWLTPSAARQRWAALGASRVVAFSAREPLHRGHEALLRQTAGRLDAGLLLDPGTGWPRAGDLTQFTQLRLCRTLATHCLNPERTWLTTVPLAPRWAGPREALWQALAYRNHGATHFLVADHHADPGRDRRGRPFHAAQAARELLDQFAPETGVTAVAAPDFAYFPDEDRYVERESTPPATTACPLSSRALLDEYLNRDRPLPAWFVRPEAAALLETIHPPRSRQGFCVWFTGLSGAGKSVTARCLASLLLAHGRAVTLLDGDAVRAQLSAGLGFSRADRDANIRRIGFVAAEIVRHQGVVICAAVSPYRATRAEVRSRIGLDRFLEVFVDTPLAVCEARDTKGLYARARRGELTGFTGVNDPYEPPATPELRLDTVARSVEDNARAILTLLESHGFLAHRSHTGSVQPG